MKKVYCYIEVPDDCETLKEVWKFWISQTRNRIKVGLDPNIEFYQMEEGSP